MNKNDLIVKASKRSEISQKEMKRCITPFLECFIEAVRSGEYITIQGLGSFLIKETKEHTVNFPLNGETYVVKARKKVKFKPSGMLIIK
ncbi:HU family DNA-binding protein [Parabacteroides goldsteinii]|uniref:HU family DNA-binding protein n=1 Tax=Parabacteroides goldsteinii TaxID=328812 RepID=UPI001D243556|nr:HU family DNA-binding protein [Parabacteroides goldsteinii]